MPQVLTPAIHNSCYRGIVPAIGITLLFYITRDAFAFVVSGRSEDFPLPQLSCYLGRSKPIHNIQPDFIDHIGSLTVGYAHGQCPGSRQQAELGKPFPQEAELKEKSARLAELNAELNIDDRTPLEQAAENVVAKRPSVLGKLKVPSVHGAGEKKKSHEQEAR